MSVTSIEYPSIVINPLEVNNSVKTFELSTKYLKRFTKIAMLNIINRRIQVPDEEFIGKSAYDKVPYFIFKRKSKNTFVREYHRQAGGVLDALEKEFLDEMQMLIVRKSTNEVLETYTFQYKYNDKDQGKSKKKDADKVREAMLSMLTAINELPGNKWPENDVKLWCEVLYREDTPETYNPPHFGPSKNIAPLDDFEVVPIGEIDTGFHKLIGQGKGVNFETAKSPISAPASVEEEPELPESMEKEPEPIEEEGEFIENEPLSLSPEINRQFNNLQTRNKRANVDEIIESPKKTKLELNETMEDKISDTVSSIVLEHCACKWRNLEEKYELINCSRCCESVHWVCNGYFDSGSIDKDQFICLSCGSNNKRSNMFRARLRLVLYGTFWERGLPNVLRKAAASDRQEFLNKMEKYGVIQQGSTEINGSALLKMIKKRFHPADPNSAYLYS